MLRDIIKYVSRHVFHRTVTSARLYGVGTVCPRRDACAQPQRQGGIGAASITNSPRSRVGSIEIGAGPEPEYPSD